MCTAKAPLRLQTVLQFATWIPLDLSRFHSPVGNKIRHFFCKSRPVIRTKFTCTQHQAQTALSSSDLHNCPLLHSHSYHRSTDSCNGNPRLMLKHRSRDVPMCHLSASFPIASTTQQSQQWVVRLCAIGMSPLIKLIMPCYYSETPCPFAINACLSTQVTL